MRSDVVFEVEMCCSSAPNGGRCIAINLRSAVERVLRPLQAPALIEYVRSISGSKRAHNVANGNVYRACNLCSSEPVSDTHLTLPTT